ncbi:MAG: CBS domain-containing protein [Bacteroidetes Order II. Incertae sedis bacterium]|jgi:CBS domain-containing protein|nr:CBS domain-containing protein [Bacteroidetes Order II. bacterium]MDG1754034.1 CBS domain-containing protein [Rhodothermales bacterium]MBT4051507.1 CBS domain-containing protein [Bacteroidetes Order II. bacterium]MBT4602911.1 CBS domain-containing protein [Bacteroidetes Order II. bacterium]MBT5250127.1 CBS domain-containing protein [Bacteroidetes Order II. bacterium]
MGQQEVSAQENAAEIRRFTRHIMQDMRALEYMLDQKMFETDTMRIGAEQEIFLVDKQFQPSPKAEEVLSLSTNERLVNELTRFNLEINLDPLVLESQCFSTLEKTLNELISEVRSLCHEVDADIVLAGILPTIHAWDLRLENMAPKPRYYSLNDTIMGLKGGLAQYHIRGVDELFFQHDNIMVEGCNTSFQVHFQVTPENFAHFYNIAQLVSAPVLAASANSPVLFGKRLWRETRIALFQQAVDTRSSNLYLRDMSPRVHFGTEWVNETVSEVFQEDIARFRVIMTSDYEDPFNALEKGEVPKLRALQLHNGTVYRWNRACYGISGSQPHLRIENRYLPAGPTVVDEVANSAFWAGLMHGIALKTDDIRPLMDFDDAKSNFIGTARRGLASEVDWIDGKRWRARDLIQNELVDIAAEGLRSRQVNEDDIQRYMGIIRDRVANSQTGAQWQLSSLAAMKRKGGTSRAERLDHLVECMQKRQLDGEPGHTWPLADIEPRAVNTIYGTRVEHFMSTDLFTVREDELVDFVAVLMSWQHIRHVLVEDIEHRLVGLVTHRSILKSLTNFNGVQEDEDIPVSQIMVRDPISVSPEMATIDAVRVMRENNIGALPVVLNGQLVGIITETDFNQLAARLFEDKAKAIQPDSE